MTGQNSQVLVSLCIVAALVLLGVGLIGAGVWLKDGGPVWGGIGSIIGALATALNTPSGTTAAIEAAKKPTPTPETDA